MSWLPSNSVGNQIRELARFSRAEAARGDRRRTEPDAAGDSWLLRIVRNRILVVDADVSVPHKAQRRGNTIKLPCDKGATKTERSPENVIKRFLQRMINAADGPEYAALLRLNIKNPSSDKIQQAFFEGGLGASSERTSSKAWWVNHWQDLKSWRVIHEWAACHPTEVHSFISAFEKAVAITSHRLK